MVKPGDAERQHEYLAPWLTVATLEMSEAA